MRSIASKKILVMAVCALVFAALSTDAQQKTEIEPTISATVPDVVGIRPGMPAQEAYNLLKARNAKIQIGLGQTSVPALGEKPIVVEMAALVADATAPEIITLWLTTPPSKQVVFAVGRQLEYDQNRPLLQSTVLENLRKKYGAESVNTMVGPYWAFDEQGKRPDAVSVRQLNCMSVGHGSYNVMAPPSPTFNTFTPILYNPEAVHPCDSFIKVNAQLDSTNGLDRTYVHRITVTIVDMALARRSQVAYQQFLANGDEAKRKAELEKAKQRKGPDF